MLIAGAARKTEELFEFARWKISAVKSESSSDLSSLSSKSSGSDSSEYFSLPVSSEDVEEENSVNSENKLIESTSSMPVLDNYQQSVVDREMFQIPAVMECNTDEYVGSPKIPDIESSDSIRDLLETLQPLDTSVCGPRDIDKFRDELNQSEENSDQDLIDYNKSKKQRRCNIL